MRYIMCMGWQVLFGMMILGAGLPGCRRNVGRVAPDCDGGVIAVSSGATHTCVVTQDGRGLCWGGNEFGQLGDGTTSPHSSAVPVQGLPPIVSITTGAAGHTCALTDDGNVWCWGNNAYGYLGDGTQEPRFDPQLVTGIHSVTQILAGGSQTCALATAGAAWCWGSNSSGQVGVPGLGFWSTPTELPSHYSGTTVAAGDMHTCVTNQHDVWCWGQNHMGQLGDGTLEDAYEPVEVELNAIAETTDVPVNLTAGGYHTCVTRLDETVWCWGGNHFGQLGDGRTHQLCTQFDWDCSTAPVQVAGANGIKEISAGMFHTCAVSRAGSVWCWGSNLNGQLGDGQSHENCITGADCSPAPVQVPGLPPIAKISAGTAHTCAVSERGCVFCWGSNQHGQLGPIEESATCNQVVCSPLPARLEL